MKKWLAFLLSAMLLLTSLPTGLADGLEAVEFEAEADGVEEDAVFLETEEVEADGDEAAPDGEDAGFPLDGGDLAMEIEPSAEELEEAFLEAPEALEDDADDPLDDDEAAESGEWRYARVCAEDTAVWTDASGDAVLTALAGGDVVLVLDPEATRLPVAFDTSVGVVEGYVDADALEYLDDADAEAFLDVLVRQGEVRAYQGDLSWLLARLDCALDGDATIDGSETGEEIDVSDPEDVQMEEAAEVYLPDTDIDAIPEHVPDATEGEALSSPDALDDTLKAGEPEAVSEGSPAAEPTDGSDAAPEPEDAKLEETSDPAEGGAETPDDSGETGEDSDQTPEAGDAGENAGADGQGPDADPEKADGPDGAEAGEAVEATPEAAQAAQATPSPAPVKNKAVLPTKVKLNHTKGTVGVGEVFTGLVATLEPADAQSTLTWKCYNTEVLLVDAKTGRFKGLKKGSTTLVVRTANGKSAACRVTVVDAPGKVSVSPASVELWEGQTKQLGKPAVPSGSSCSSFTYTSNKTSVARVSSAGKITAVGKGTATVTVKTYNGKKATVKVTVKALPRSVMFTRAAVDMYPGQALKLTAKAYDGLNGTGSTTPSTVTYAVSPDGDGDPECVKVTSAGAVTALREGTAYVRATAHNGVASVPDCVIRVLPEAERIELSESTIEVGVGETCDRLKYTVEEGTATSVTWSTSNAKVATVNKTTGAVTGVKAGTATITATPHTGAPVSCSVTVKPAPTKVVLSPASLTVDNLEPVQIEASVNSGSVTNGFTYVYGDAASKKVVSLNRTTGTLTPLRSGTARIDVKAYNGVHRVFTLKVNLPVEYVEIGNEAAVSRIFEFQSLALKVTALDAMGGNPETALTFEAEDGTGSVSVSATGVVRGVSAGTAKVRVYAGDASAECDIAVRVGPKKITLSPARKTIGVGETLALNPVLTDKAGQTMAGAFTVTTTGAGKKAVTCDSRGTVRAKAAGKAVVTVKHANGVSARVTITVKKKPWAVKLTPAKATLGVGQTKALKALLPSGTAGKCTFKSSKTSVATVDAATGKVTAVGVGKTTITVTTYNGRKAKATVTVTRAPKYIVLTGKGLAELTREAENGTYVTRYQLILKKGGTHQLKGRVEYPARGSLKSYSSSSADVATVSKTGLITALKPGKTTITVTATGGARARVDVFVWGQGAAPGKSLAFAGDELVLSVGETLAAPELKASGIPDGDLLNVNMLSADDAIATTSRDGNYAWTITGQAVGQTLISATAGGVTTAMTVQVVEAEIPAQLPEDEGIHFAQAEYALAEGESASPELLDEDGNPVTEGTDEFGMPVRLTLESADPEIVIAGEGRLTGVSAGTTTVSASYGAQKAYARVTVKPEYVNISLAADSRELFVGERFDLGATTNGGSLRYVSTDTNVARVSSMGTVTAVGAGQAQIVACTVDVEAAATCSVTVLRHISKVAVSPATKAGKVGGTLTLTATVGAPDEVGTVTFQVANEQVAALTTEQTKSVSNGKATCKLKLLSTGTTLVRVSTDNGYSTAASITVKDENAVTYRLFTACGFAMPGYTGPGKLPFTLHNTQVVRKVLGGSGMKYAVSANLVNPSRSKLSSALKTFAGKADSNDVSVIYLTSHGQTMAKDKKSGYYMSLPVVSDTGVTFQKITSGEIMSALSSCKGKVVLMLDSCYSGAFIQDQRTRLDRAGGRISVITAARNTKGSYYMTNDTSVSMDFFTQFLMLGLGYDSLYKQYIKNEKRDRGAAPGYMLADAYRNPSLKDGVITLEEMYDFASRSIAANIPNYSSQSWYWGPEGGTQRSNSYLGSNGNLPLYKPKI